jgi:hypothetical protein
MRSTKKQVFILVATGNPPANYEAECVIHVKTTVTPICHCDLLGY